MAHTSKRAKELIETFATVGNAKRLTKEFKALKKAEKEMKQASENITRILKGEFKRKGKKR